MNSICLFEAGGTKTTLLIDQNGTVQSIELPGFNPNRYSSDFENALAKIDLPGDASLIFYGSGLVSEANKEIIRKILLAKTGLTAEIYDDQLGAARAAYGDSPGLIGIMGTGAFAAWYNGKSLEDRKGGYGYLIDDIGGGFELGKIIISKWLNGDLPKEADQAISMAIRISKEDFTTEFYKSPDLNLIASLAKLILPYSTDIGIAKIITDYFDLFFERHVQPLMIKHPANSITLVGGIAVNFQKLIQISAANANLNALNVIGNPSLKLFEYHQGKII
jgi:N-acetylglucosamine kinase-like BadF-type ATPase